VESVIPQEVVDTTSVNQFKNRLDKFWQRYIGIKKHVVTNTSLDSKCK